MYLITALCLLCVCVWPHACRSADAEALAHRRRDNNIAELLIPLLERSLTQGASEERTHRRKAGKKVIQVLPYRGSDEHKRKGWRKLNSHKKQVVEITPLHGKNRAKPLAYILSAAKPSHGEHVERNEDVSSINTSELEHDKSSSEEQHSSEGQPASESGDVTVNAVRDKEDAFNTPASSIQQSSENISSKDISVSNKESSATSTDVQDESVSDQNTEITDEITREESLYEISSDDKSASDVNLDSNETKDNKATASAVESSLSSESDDLTAEESNTLPESAEEQIQDSVAEESVLEVTVEEQALSKESLPDETNVSPPDNARQITPDDTKESLGDENKENPAEETKESLADETNESPAEETKENSAVETKESSADENKERPSDNTKESPADVNEENFTSETDDEEALTSEVTPENVTERQQLASEEFPEEISNLIDDSQGKESLTAEEPESEDSNDNLRRFTENDIVIGRSQQDVESAEKTFSKLFNARARDIIELIQSSVEASTAPQQDCFSDTNSHSHDHKSYRLSFLFNK